jgi:U3 small nucleolar RNA-associated protein 3
MAKKRKASRRSGESDAPRDDGPKLAISTYANVADSEDEFHLNRDQILLDEAPAAKRMRKWREQGKPPS